ncbi:hypothetical protein LJR225_000241 [Phenylobacterium sp. LjRoot225]|uniref:hypothetical protein n=1 Tax=Phenylobacterium sp. LjRoot225 TaxID=3342285 RepID=UPI003ECED221
MRSVLVAAALAAAALPAAAEPAAAQTAATAALSVQTTPIAVILKNAAAKAVFEKEIPGLRLFYGRIGAMTVAELASRSKGRIDETKMQAIQAGFDKIR